MLTWQVGLVSFFVTTEDTVGLRMGAVLSSSVAITTYEQAVRGTLPEVAYLTCTGPPRCEPTASHSGGVPLRATTTSAAQRPRVTRGPGPDADVYFITTYV